MNMRQRGQDDPLPQPPHARSSDLLSKQESGPQLMTDEARTDVDESSLSSPPPPDATNKAPAPTSDSSPIKKHDKNNNTKGQQRRRQVQSSHDEDGKQSVKSEKRKRCRKGDRTIDDANKPAATEQEQSSIHKNHRARRLRASEEDNDTNSHTSSQSLNDDDDDLVPGATQIHGRLASADGKEIFDNLGINSNRPHDEQLPSTPSNDVVVEAHLAPDADDIEREIEARVSQQVAKHLQETSSNQQQGIERQEEAVESNPIVVEAVRVEEEESSSRRSRLRCYGMIGIVIVGIAATIGIVLGTSSSPEPIVVVPSPSNAPTTGPTEILYSPRFEELYQQIGSLVSESPRQTLRDPATFQHQALSWMANDDLWEATALEFGTVDAQRLVERYVLALVYWSLGGPRVDGSVPILSAWAVDYNFLSPLSVCQWTEFIDGFHRGVICGDEEGEEVTALRMPANGLQGDKIPTELALLTSLGDLNLGQNLMGGTIPALGLPTSLKRLWLGQNVLQGSIPLELGEHLTKLTNLILKDNFLDGTLATELFLLDKLTYLDLSNNRLIGTLPTQVGQLVNIQSWMSFGDNRLTGTIPTEIGLFTKLQALWLRTNEITGFMPTELGLLTNLRDLGIFETDIAGELPSELGLATSLTQLLVYSMPSLSGPVPPEIAALPLLEIFQSGGTPLTDFEETFCSRAVPLTSLTTDCGRVECSCCTSCRAW